MLKGSWKEKREHIHPIGMPGWAKGVDGENRTTRAETSGILGLKSVYAGGPVVSKKQRQCETSAKEVQLAL